MYTQHQQSVAWTQNVDTIAMSMHGSRKFCQRGSKYVFLVDEGREDPNTTISRPSSAASKMPFKWRFAGMPMIAQHWMSAR